jgi:hypothetical protein
VVRRVGSLAQPQSSWGTLLLLVLLLGRIQQPSLRLKQMQQLTAQLSCRPQVVTSQALGQWACRTHPCLMLRLMRQSATQLRQAMLMLCRAMAPQWQPALQLRQLMTRMHVARDSKQKQGARAGAVMKQQM